MQSSLDRTHLTRLAVALLLAACLPALLGQPHLLISIARAEIVPESAARSIAERYMATFNSGDPSLMLAFQAENLSTEALARRGEEERRRMYAALWGDLGAVQVERIEPRSDGVEATARSAKMNEVARFSFDLESVPPYKIRGIRIELGSGGPAFDLPDPGLRADLDLDERIAAFGRWLADLAGQDLFSGVVLVAEGDRVLLEQAYGLASRAEGIPNRPATRFNIGSIGKSFTQVAIAQLAAAGKLSYEQRIADLLPDYPNPAVARRVTVRHLCAHTSGLGDFFGPRFEQTPKEQIRKITDYFPLFVTDSLSFEPGERFSYSNAGYAVLGAIVERVSGRSYPEYLAEHIFAPAEMATAGFLDLDRPAPDRAVGYTRERDSDPWQPSTRMQPVRGSSAGGAYATARDLLRFAAALRDGRLLPPGRTRVAADSRLPGGRGPEMAIDEPLAMGMAGGSPGWNAVLETEGDRVLVITANLDPPIAEEIAKRVSPALLGAGAN